MKTRIFAIVLVLLMVLSAVACSGNGDPTTGTTTTPPPAPEAKDLSVVLESLMIQGGMESGMGWNVTIPDTKEITLKALFETYVQEGESFDKTLEQVNWTVNGVAATGDTVLKNGDKALATAKDYEPIAPESGKMMVKVLINDTTRNMYQFMNMQVPTGDIALKAFFETYIARGGSTTFESTLEEYKWFVNDVAATATTNVPANATISANYTPIPTIKIEMTAIVNGETLGTHTFTVREGTTLKAFYEAESEDETFEESLTSTIWTVNGAPATASTVLKEGDKIVASYKEPDKEYEGDYSLPY